MLAKVVRQQADAVALAEKRAEVLSCVEEFEAVRAECRWLSEYENDEMRYKVRPASWPASGSAAPSALQCTCIAGSSKENANPALSSNAI